MFCFLKIIDCISPGLFLWKEQRGPPFLLPQQLQLVQGAVSFEAELRVGMARMPQEPAASGWD